MAVQLNKSDMHNYQTFASNHVFVNYFCGLIMDMGLGKTISILTTVNRLIYEELEIENVLIVAPKRVVLTVWNDEIEKWTHLKNLSIVRVIGDRNERIKALNTKANIHIISRDNFAWLCGLYGGMKLPFDMLILDESSSFKSYKSQRFKAARAVRPSFKRVVILTGTPVPNGLLDLWAQMYLVDRGERLEKTISRYREKYFKPGQTSGHVVFNYNLITDGEKLIHEKIDDICISMKAADYLELPERVDNFVKIKMPIALKRQYDDFEKSKVLELMQAEGNISEERFYHEDEEILEDSEVKQISVVNAAALSNKLLQFANGAVYDEDREVHHIHDLKIEALNDIIDDSGGKNIMVAWAYRHDLDRLKVALKQYKPRELKTEQDIRDWNNGLIRIALVHPKSAGHGLNLQAGGSIIVWFGLTWSLEEYQQLNARLHRQGQTEVVTIHHIILDDTHDNDVMSALNAKDRKQENLMKAIKAKITKYLKS